MPGIKVFVRSGFGKPFNQYQLFHVSEDRSKYRWNSIHSVLESKVALAHLLNKVVLLFYFLYELTDFS